MMLLQVTVAILLCFLSSQVNGLLTANATCLPGYESWTFSSIGQSPCDIAVELASVCTDQFNLAPLSTDAVYKGPSVVEANDCTCSSVFYSLVAACSDCQGGLYFAWSLFSANCPTVYVGSFPEQIPPGVEVPAYAYQNVTISNIFNLTIAQDLNGVKSTGLPSSTTSTSVISTTTNSMIGAN